MKNPFVFKEDFLNLNPEFNKFCKTDKRGLRMLLDMGNNGGFYCVDYGDIKQMIESNTQFKFIETTPENINLFKEQILQFKNAIIFLEGGSRMTLDGTTIFLFENITAKLEDEIHQAYCDYKIKKGIIKVQIILIKMNKELIKQIVSLGLQGKKDEIKKLYPQIIEEMPWLKEVLEK